MSLYRVLDCARVEASTSLATTATGFPNSLKDCKALLPPALSNTAASLPGLAQTMASLSWFSSNPSRRLQADQNWNALCRKRGSGTTTVLSSTKIAQASPCDALALAANARPRTKGTRNPRLQMDLSEAVIEKRVLVEGRRGGPIQAICTVPLKHVQNIGTSDQVTHVGEGALLPTLDLRSRNPFSYQGRGGSRARTGSCTVYSRQASARLSFPLSTRTRKFSPENLESGNSLSLAAFGRVTTKLRKQHNTTGLPAAHRGATWGQLNMTTRETSTATVKQAVTQTCRQRHYKIRALELQQAIISYLPGSHSSDPPLPALPFPSHCVVLVPF